MSAKVRATLAQIASTVDGIDIEPHYHQDLTPGNGMVRRDRTDYPNSHGGVVTWQIVIFLPLDLVDAQDWLDDTVPAVVDALAQSGEITVTSFEPQQLSLGSSSYPIALIQGLRETE